MNEIIASIREKYPQYNDVPDDELTLKIADRYPQYLDNDSFKTDVERLRSSTESSPDSVPVINNAEGILLDPATGSKAAAVGTLLGIATGTGGPNVAMPDDKSLGGILWEASSEPFVSIPRAKPRDPTSSVDKVSAGVANALISVAEGVESPVGIATLGLGVMPRTIQKLAGVVFAGIGTKATAEKLGEASVTKDPQTAAEGVTLGLLTPLAFLPFKKPAAPSEFTPLTESALKAVSEVPETVAPQAAPSPEAIAMEIGYKFNPTKQIGGVKLEGLPPELAAQMEASAPTQWEFTNPKTGATFYMPEGATREQIVARAKAKDAEFSEGQSAQVPEPPIGIAESAEVKMRRSAARATEAEAIPEPVQEQIAKAPESFYSPQSMDEVAAATSKMSDVELGAVSKESDLYVASKLEQAKRLFNDGKSDAGYEVFVELEKEGTRLGQLINQFKFLESVNPVHVATVIDRRLVKAGKDPLTSQQREGVIVKTTESQSAARELEAAKDNWVQNPTPENAAIAESALERSNKADVEVQRLVDRFEPKTIPGTLSTILKGNLLTPISLSANVVGNWVNVPFRASTRTVASVIDIIDSYVRNRPREIAVRPMTGTIEAAKGMARGSADIPEILKEGSGAGIKGEKSQGLHPLSAWRDQFASTPDIPTEGGKLTFADRTRLAIEGTFGIPAEVFLRSLASGDRPFREAARARIIANEAKLSGVPKAQLSMAQKFPELFFNKEILQRIESETLESIFQRKSNSIQYVMKLLGSRGPWVELMTSTVAPYKLTPWNIAVEVLSYNPLVASARTAYHIARGSVREAKMDASKFIVGSVATAAAWWLYRKGLLSPSMSSPDERNKARILAGEIMPPNHINISGLERALSGGDPQFQSGDRTMDVFRAGGIAGSIMYMTANIGRDMEKQPADTENVLAQIGKNSTLEQFRFSMNQSFLQGVGGMFEAIRTGQTDNYMRQWASTVLSMPLPNTLNTLSRSTRPFKVDVNGFDGVLRTRLGIFGADDEMPLKRGLWGEPIPETPEGRNEVLYHFFDITKQRNITDDPVAIEIYKLWRGTGSNSAIPEPPEKSITLGRKTYPLAPDQYSRLSELVGVNRRALVEAVIQNPEWESIESDAKLRVLEAAYRKGSEVGKALFLKETPMDMLIEKPKLSGFKKN